MKEIMQQEGSVNIEIVNGIATISFFHPASNALPGHILQQLADAITSVSVDMEVKVIVLKSEGERAFCAGASFDELVAISNEAEGLKFFTGFARVINAARKSHKIIIGRVQGKAVGGGVGIAAACDYTFAVKTAAVKLSELAVGIGPFVVGPVVAHKIGNSCYAQLALDATEFRTAAWAHAHGLYAEVYETVADMDEAVAKLAERLASSNPDALSALKKTFWQGTEHWDELLTERAKISGQLVLSEFTRNAIQKFKQKIPA